MREPAVAAAIARAMAAFHIQMLADPPAVQQAQQGAEQGQQQQPRPAIWGRIRNWHEVAQELAPKEVAALGLSSALEEVRSALCLLGVVCALPTGVWFALCPLVFVRSYLFPLGAKRKRAASETSWGEILEGGPCWVCSSWGGPGCAACRLGGGWLLLAGGGQEPAHAA